MDGDPDSNTLASVYPAREKKMRVLMDSLAMNDPKKVV